MEKMGKRILVVDDEELIRNMFERVFHKAGYNVRCAEGGQEALSILQGEKMQVMFLDLKMPNMDGVQLCRQIRKDNPMAIINAVTGYASLFDLMECREAGFDDYYTKPVDINILLKAAQDAFEKIDRWKQR